MSVRPSVSLSKNLKVVLYLQLFAHVPLHLYLQLHLVIGQQTVEHFVVFHNKINTFILQIINFRSLI